MLDITTDGPVIADSPFKIKNQPLEVLEPFADRVVVRPDSAEEMIGSFYVPDVAQERPARGTVLAVGPGHRLDDGSYVPLTVQPGDRVIYGHFTGAEAVYGREAVLVLREADLFAKVRPG
jgi:chaperonin GroES